MSSLHVSVLLLSRCPGWGEFFTIFHILHDGVLIDALWCLCRFVCFAVGYQLRRNCKVKRSDKEEDMRRHPTEGSHDRRQCLYDHPTIHQQKGTRNNTNLKKKRRRGHGRGRATTRGAKQRGRRIGDQRQKGATKRTLATQHMENTTRLRGEDCAVEAQQRTWG